MRYRETKKGKSTGLASKSKIVENKKTSYSSRYVGELAPKDKIVEKVTPTYSSRYK